MSLKPSVPVRPALSIRWLLLPLLIFVFSCTRDKDEPGLPQNTIAGFSAEVPLAWNKVYLDLERFTPGYRPPVSARAMGYVGLAAYECAQPGMAEDYRSMSDYFPGLDLPQLEAGEEYYLPLALVATYERILELFFPTAPSEQLFKIYELKNKFFLEFRGKLDVDVFNRSVQYGQEVAEAVFEWSSTDQFGHEGYLRNNDPNYTPPSGPGLWQPTYPDYSPALLPNWGQVRTFVADENDVVQPPLAYAEAPGSELYQQAIEVQEETLKSKQTPDSEGRWIADFWSDDCPILTFTPAGRWLSVLNQVVEIEEKPLDKALEAYARMGMALADSGIRCWHEKYKYNYERPIDYIRRVMGDQNFNTVMCPDGSGQFYTPPFPAYPSGHATFGGAAAEVMTDLFGDGYAMVDSCHVDRTEFNGKPRSFNNFREMANENGESRIYLGVHFRMDSDAGLDLGAGIGQKVNSLPWRN